MNENEAYEEETVKKYLINKVWDLVDDGYMDSNHGNHWVWVIKHTDANY